MVPCSSQWAEIMRMAVGREDGWFATSRMAWDPLESENISVGRFEEDRSISGGGSRGMGPPPWLIYSAGILVVAMVSCRLMCESSRPRRIYEAASRADVPAEL